MTSAIAGVFCERQRSGGTCRIHAINNLFGKKVVTESSFRTFQAEYEQYLQSLSSALSSTQISIPITELGYDSIESTRTFILPFILEQLFQLTSFWIAPYEFSKLKRANILRGLLDVLDFDQNRFFVMNMNHVWCIKKLDDGGWYEIDSIRGVRPVEDLGSLAEQKQLGFLMPWGKKRAIAGVSEMQRLVSDYFGAGISHSDICVMLLRDLSQREPHHFGDCQIWISLFFKYLKFVDSEKQHFVAEIASFEQYEQRRATSPLDLVHAMIAVPPIIIFIVHEGRRHCHCQ